MILVNNYVMKNISLNKNMHGTFYAKKQILRFEKPNNCLDDDDIINLFMGFLRLIKKSVELEVEERYLLEIRQLKNRLKKFEK
jgi:hypothetical protein